MNTNLSLIALPLRCVAAALLMLAATGCATRAVDRPERVSADQADDTNDSDDTNDPAESANRKIFAANMLADRAVVRPAAQTYLEKVAPDIRTGVRNFVRNLKEPTVALNDLAQGNFNKSFISVQRFAINSTVGIAGIRDVAKDWDRQGHAADFGQTMGVWGLASGPSVQVPLLGPSNVRDLFGTVVDSLINPLGMTSVAGLAVAGTSAVDARAGMLAMTDELEATSIDYYATLRSVAAQRRQALVEQGRAAD